MYSNQTSPVTVRAPYCTPLATLELMRSHQALPDLPIWAQVLVASRMVRRAVTPMIADVSPMLRIRSQDIYLTVERCVRVGACYGADRETLHQSLTHLCEDCSPELSSLFDALKPLVKSAFAAEAACHTPFEERVTRYVWEVIWGLLCHARSPMASAYRLLQLHNDIVGLQLVCQEARWGKFDPVPDAFVLRLATPDLVGTHTESH